MPDEPIDDNVVKLDPDKKAPWLKHKRRTYRCRHLQVTICEESRVVECDFCGASLDPVMMLLDIADGERIVSDRENAIRAANVRLSALKKEERLTKARLKRALARLKEL